MKIEIENRGAFASAIVSLQAGEHFVSEAGAMYRASSNIDIDVTTRTKGGGGVLAGLKRLLASESFFFSKYTVEGAGEGHVGLAPVHQGELRVIEVEPKTTWFCTGGSFMGASEDIDLDTQFQGLKGFLGGESLSFLRATGEGSLLVSAFGRLAEIDVESELIVDTGHVVAFDDNLEYSISKAGTSWMHSFFGGEGLVFRFRRKPEAIARGRLIVQSHNPKDLGPRLGAMLPPKPR
ncbi:MAG: TIGR00266 family protein [Planctomycetes bacterium]|nr:TIGR00266 family protein [Planctomycetota bacterium]